MHADDPSQQAAADSSQGFPWSQDTQTDLPGQETDAQPSEVTEDDDSDFIEEEDETSQDGAATQQADSATGPVGQGEYTVRQGDCMESIAVEHGLFWQTIWNHPDNAELKRCRKDPNALLPGDRVHVPEKRLKEESGATETRHRFRRKGVPSMLRLTLEDENGDPLAEKTYTIEIDGTSTWGTTDGNGKLEVPVPPEARTGTLRIELDGKQIEYPLELGQIDPITEVSGVQGRLNNIGFDCGKVTGRMNEQTTSAIRNFQREYELDVTGQMDQETKDKLEEVYNS